MRHLALLAVSALLGASACTAKEPAADIPAASSRLGAVDFGIADLPFNTQAIATFDQPWAMTFLPDGRLLVSEKPGELILINQDGSGRTGISGVPPVDFGGQGGFGDVEIHPQFADNRTIYLSYVEAGDDDTRGAVVARATLDLANAKLDGVETIWQQVPKVTGRGHYAHRIAFSPDGYLYISSGDRQKFDPAQDMGSNLGKILRLNDDGTIPTDNPFFAQGGIAAQVWSLGHRNPLGIRFDANGQLWNTEMGPRHGDELNRVVRGANYGYPLVSNGNHYDGKKIPDHDTRPDLAAPAAYWVPAISPSGFLIYNGDKFAAWKGNALLGGMSAVTLVRVVFDGEKAEEAERYPLNIRIREIEQGPDGLIWMLEDGPDGRLMRLSPN